VTKRKPAKRRSQSLGHKTVEDVEAYSAGRQAWDRGIPKGSCPYESGSRPAQKWAAGWTQARDDSSEGYDAARKESER
jgi:ribosome modulation factor